MKKILIIGGNSYIGSELTIFLSKFKSYQITSIDIGFNDDCVFNNHGFLFPTKKIDVRNLDEKFLQEFEIVVFLAGLSLFLINPITSIKEENAYEITEKYTKKIILMCKKNKIKFIFPSSCSVYGMSNTNELVDENSIVNPITFYSKNKIIIENFLKEQTNNEFKPIILRLATVFGFSERMRFDIVANMFVGMAMTTNEIVLNSNGEAFRPFVYIKDVCKVFKSVIDFIGSNTKCEIFNVGSNYNNIKIIELAKLISKILPNTKIKFLNENIKLDKNLFKDNQIVKNGSDKRNYKVNFNKISAKFIDFQNTITLEKGIYEMIKNLREVNFALNDFNNINFHRLKKLNYLIDIGKVNKNLEYIN